MSCVTCSSNTPGCALPIDVGYRLWVEVIVLFFVVGNWERSINYVRALLCFGAPWELHAASLRSPASVVGGTGYWNGVPEDNQLR